MNNVTMLIDLQYGSTGKGLVAGYLSEHNEYDTVISANMPNAGHTAWFNDHRFIHKVLPSGIFSPHLKRIMVGPGAVFSIEQLQKELLRIKDVMFPVWEERGQPVPQIMIHAQSTVLTKEHVEAEQASGTVKIASTAQGSKEAMIARLHRDPDNNPTAGKNPRLLSEFDEIGFNVQIIEHRHWIKTLVRESKMTLAEGAQGYSLGISQDFYPYTTSRDCTPFRFAADMGIPYRTLYKIIGVLRTYPIRVGNTDQGKSGGIYSDQEELSWEQLGQEPEITTVTGRVRRVFSFSWEQLVEATRECGPDEIFINFMNYLPPEEHLKFYKKVNFICPVKYLGYGPRANNVVDLT